MNVLLVKMSSLGDIVHTLPALHDAARHGVRFDWVVEEGYRAVPARVAAVDRVLEVAFRRWRTAPIAFGAELRAFRERLRQRRYELVLDAQGLLKSAVVGCWARTDERVGFDAASARERVAALAYRRGISVPQDWHAIDRTRRLFAHALGYEVPDREPAFGLRAPQRRTSRVGNESGNAVVFAHGTTWPTKHWPEAFWADLARIATDQGFVPLLPWADGERARAERIARGIPGARVCARMDLDDAMGLLAHACGVVGVDSGLAHLGAALGRPTVMLFGPSDPSLTGCRGRNVRNLTASLACSPCRSKQCRLSRQLAHHADHWPPCLGNVEPSRAWSALLEAMAKQPRNVAGL